jgi:glyoxylase I family protein
MRPVILPDSLWPYVEKTVIEIEGLDHLVLRVTDLEKMIAFYCNVLGCSIEWRRPDLGLVHLRAGCALIDLVTVDGPSGIAGGKGPGIEGRNLDHFCLGVRNFDQAGIQAHLDSHGVNVGKIASRFGARGRGISIYVTDPEGNGLELKGIDAAPDPQQQASKTSRCV